VLTFSGIKNKRKLKALNIVYTYFFDEYVNIVVLCELGSSRLFYWWRS